MTIQVNKVTTPTEIIAIGDPRYIKLDQTTPQTITGDTPKLDVLKSKTILGTDANGKIGEGTHQDISGKENSLGNPDVDGKVLSSTVLGVRSWIDNAAFPGFTDLLTDYGFTDNSATWDALVSFPGFTDLLTDYGFTDNSATWDALVSFPGFTDLLTDYGFTDNSATWDALVSFPGFTDLATDYAGDTPWTGMGYITGVSWDEIGGNQADISLSNFNDDLSYLSPGGWYDADQDTILLSGFKNDSSAYMGVYRESWAGAESDHNINDVGETYIANKHLSYISVGSFEDNFPLRNGGLRSDYSDETSKWELEHYDEDAGWERLLKGVKLQNLTADLVTDDFSYQISLFSGNSLEKDGNNIPMIQRGRTSVGAFQVPRKVIARSQDIYHEYEDNEVIAIAIEQTAHENRHSFWTTSQLHNGELLLTDEGCLYVYKDGLVGASLNCAVVHGGEIITHEGEIIWN